MQLDLVVDNNSAAIIAALFSNNGMFWPNSKGGLVYLVEQGIMP